MGKAFRGGIGYVSPHGCIQGRGKSEALPWLPGSVEAHTRKGRERGRSSADRDRTGSRQASTCSGVQAGSEWRSQVHLARHKKREPGLEGTEGLIEHLKALRPLLVDAKLPVVRVCDCWMSKVSISIR